MSTRTVPIANTSVRSIEPSPPHIGRQIIDLPFNEEPRRESPRRNRISWVAVSWLAIVHLGLLAAPFTFTWQAIVLFLALHWLTAGVGITLGFHRYFTHDSFKTYAAMRWLLAWLGGLAGQGTVDTWVADHRKHHAFSDREGDPHSPRGGFLWSHVFWLAWTYNRSDQKKHVARWAPDLEREWLVRFLSRTYILWHFLLAAVLFGLGNWLGGTALGWSFVVWGIFVRLCFVLHSTWLVNSASHMWGYCNYQTKDDSRNNWLVALLSYGEGWHNNHHADPRIAAHGHKWWEVDLTFVLIRLMQRVGLAWDVVADTKRIGRPKPRGAMPAASRDVRSTRAQTDTRRAA